ncbi:hypothetical protein HQ545_02870 [Candidatus Woesearchaeota archaeon]|nr:hypothetical protein [Candidatus Woesearchaeota archaeon]
MRINTISTIIISITVLALLMLAGCQQNLCYPPNEIIGNKCCVDEDGTGVCDFDEIESEEPDEKDDTGAQDTETQEQNEMGADANDDSELEIDEKIEEVEIDDTQTIENVEEKEPEQPTPGTYLSIDDIVMYRISRDKGMVDVMTYTVNNLGSETIEPVVEFSFDKGRIGESDVKVEKEYLLSPLKPGEQRTITKSMGVKFSGINQTKDIKMSIYHKFSAPRKNLEVIEMKVIPIDYMESLEIFPYGLPEYR